MYVGEHGVDLPSALAQNGDSLVRMLSFHDFKPCVRQCPTRQETKNRLILNDYNNVLGIRDCQRHPVIIEISRRGFPFLL